jgi:hypothetical protein
MEVCAVRQLRIGDRTFKAGEVVTGLPADKVSQLVAQRQLRIKDVEAREYMVLRRFPIGAKTYERGMKIRVKSLSHDKLHQLLEQRYLEPATD